MRRLYKHRRCHRGRAASGPGGAGGGGMNRFEYIRADSVAHAIDALAMPNAQALAGGTNLVDLLKYDVAKPARVVDINRLPLRSIEETPNGGLKIGALVSNS